MQSRSQPCPCRPLSITHTLRLSHFVPRALAALFVCMAAACGNSTAVTSVAVERHAWTEPGPDGVQFLTAHFDIRTTVRDTLLRDALPVFLETAFAEYTRLMPTPAGNSPPLSKGGPGGVELPRLPVYLFDTREEWARFTRHFRPAEAQTYLHIHAGGFTDYRTATAVTFDLGRDHTLSLLAHEGFHQYVARYRTLPLPAWLNEGLACQFETFTLDGPRPTFTPRQNLIRLGSLREALTPPNQLAALPDLLRMHAGQALRQTGPSAPTYYAQLWSTVLYLRDRSCPYAAGFRKLLQDAGTLALAQAIRDHRAENAAARRLSDAEVAFHRYITPDLETFAAGYRKFAEQLVGNLSK
jgi:hypothetical protein